ncbi:MAG: type II secretion system protein J [Planctomycetaceae bacterium]
MKSPRTTIGRVVSRRRAFTLLELTISLFVSSILMLGLGSAIYIATQATDPDLGALRDSRESGTAAFDVMAELQQAQAFTVRTATTVEFTVADRNGDSLAETIRYSWSGKPGHPLTRRFNGGKTVTVVEDVHDWNLTYDTKTVAPDDTSFGGELLLKQDQSNSGTAAVFDVYSNRRLAGFFKPAMPADALSWQITRVKFIGIAKTGKGTISVEVREPGPGGVPGNKSIDAVEVPASNLSGVWHEVHFANAGGLSPSTGYFITIARASGGVDGAGIQIGTNSTTTPGTTYYSDAGGGVWVQGTTSDVWLKVWGTISTSSSSAPQSSPRYFVQSVGMSIQVGPDVASRVTGGVHLLNQPEVASP